ncbi:hypothetical protein OQZ33_17060 [Pedobacter sp. MC2016-05]|uniref:hypothetical protein n=1 Tax=Pedobacter sp. MC2016-05 TaxID=2994474 RepID=UPI002245C21E|nr:hypothetical protein [Pedobacter sp. MC2016-05]MCX2476046.1 hypothetical protein [Pedobacter sp. MC2016-05]
MKAFIIEAKKAQKILASHGTHITLDQTKEMLVLLEKLSELALSVLLDRAGVKEFIPTENFNKP